MGKTIRFAELVKKSGRPHVATLWGDPKKDPQFGRAIRENRILTVKQTPTAHKKDSGTIGFVEEKNVSYFVFPQPLPKKEDTQVIGIKYNLLDSGEPVGAPVAAKKTKTAPKPRAPKEHTFSVTVKRTAVIETSLTIRAKNEKEARERALHDVKSQDFEIPDAIIHDEVRGVTREHSDAP